jgi:thiamine-monophosphate kinase
MADLDAEHAGMRQTAGDRSAVRSSQADPAATEPSVGTLSSIGEFGLIDRIRRMTGEDPAGHPGIGIGDDAAVIPAGAGRCLLATTDMLVEGRHFRRDWIQARDLGWKSLAVNVSDIAGMGGGTADPSAPMHAFLSFALPSDLPVAWIDEFTQGLADLCRQWNIRLSGGDTTRSANGITINITLLSWADSDLVLLRSGARDGDLLCVTGSLGDSGAGLRLLMRRGARTDSSELDRRLIAAHHHPRIWIDESRWLASTGAVRSMMDISDGIAGDASHIAARSGMRCVIDADLLPLSGDLLAVGQREGWSPHVLAASAGEDYGLLFTLDPDRAASVSAAFRSRFGTPFTIIGKVEMPEPVDTTPDNSVRFMLNGRPWRPETRGFDHFQSTTPEA